MARPRDRFVYDEHDVPDLLGESVLEKDGAGWDALFGDRSRACPFFVDHPDENLAEWLETGRVAPGRVLELGCGNGRNAIHLARHGHVVDAVDLSAVAIDWAQERARTAAVAVTLHRCSIFDVPVDAGSYDLVYDSGCFHHLAPHRRKAYVELVERALRPGGRYGLVCFRPEGGSGLTDREVYRRRNLGGGLGYSEEHLRALWDGGSFAVEVLRQMRATTTDEDRFGRDFLWALLAVKGSAGAPESRGPLREP